MSRKTSAYIKKRRALGGVNPAIAKAHGSTPEQMAHAHSEALKIRAKCEVAA